MANKLIWTSLALCTASLLTAQKSSVAEISDSDKYLNWHRGKSSFFKMGTDVEKAYSKFLKGKTPKKKIIVAVIDCGVDINHPDLKDRIWTNKNEIPNNGIDDDKNGYIDDIHGWNYLGGSDGKNMHEATLEVTRVYRKLESKFHGVSEENVSSKDKESYELYKNVEEEINSTVSTYSSYKKIYVQLITKVEDKREELEKITGSQLKTIEQIDAVKSSDDKVTEDLEKLKGMYEQGLNPEDLKPMMGQINSTLDFHYNTSFTPRETIVKDDIEDIKDLDYGNGDVVGPDAFHGTFCAGIIGASIENGLGIDGIANSIEIMGLRAVPDGDEYDKDVALAIRYAVDHGAQVVNMSFGKSYSPQKWMVDEAIKYAETKGVLLIHAAGNSSENLDVSENYPSDQMNDKSYAKNVITVGASTIKPKKTIPASFSNYGKKRVDLFAPGQDIISTYTNNNYDIGDGTSYAAPVVSGIAALIWSYYPELTASELKQLLMTTATDKGNKEVVLPGSEDKVPFEKLSVSGGVVNAYAAIKKLEKK